MDNDLARVLDDESDRGGYSPSDYERETARARPYPTTTRSRQPPPANTRVFVSNLPFDASWQDVKDMMRSVGTVTFADVMLRAGRPLGCAVVEFARSDEATRAIRDLNDTIFRGRRILVREDRDRSSRTSSSSSRPNQDCRVFVGNLPYSLSWQDLKDLFRSVAHVKHADLFMDGPNRSKGAGVVTFESPLDASNAIAMYNGYELQGRRIEVREDRGSSRSALPPHRRSAPGMFANPYPIDPYRTALRSDLYHHPLPQIPLQSGPPLTADNPAAFGAYYGAWPPSFDMYAAANWDAVQRSSRLASQNLSTSGGGGGGGNSSNGGGGGGGNNTNSSTNNPQAQNYSQSQRNFYQ